MTTTTKTIDPVCGMEINPGEAAGQSEFKGETYYFCSPACREKFDAASQNFIKTAENKANGANGLPPARVIGSGTVLDTARLRFLLGEDLGIEAGSVHAYVIGEHGDSEVATWSAARVGGAPLADFCQPQCPDFPKMLETVRQAAPEIIKRKGYTSFAVASCVNRICAAILRDERTILPVSTMTGGQYGIDRVYLSLPCVVGRGGVEKIVELPLDDAERAGLLASADLLKKTLPELKNKAALSTNELL